MNKRRILLIITAMTISSMVSSCGKQEQIQQAQEQNSLENSQQITENREDIKKQPSSFGEELQELEEGLSAIQYDGDYGFEEFLRQGGASSDGEVVSYVAEQVVSDLPTILFSGNPFGCSTLSVKNREEGYLFGRNFDWNYCNAMIVSSNPENGYASIATVNTDFIQAGGMSLTKLPDQLQAMIGMYAPLDGMNETGFAVAVNMIQDTDTIEQMTDKPDITTTTAVRMLLNQAADVEEAIALLEQYDMHASMGMMVHFALADAKGQSVVVEYVKNKMVITQTPVVTNFYFAEGEKQGVGTAQSHSRYDILMERSKNLKTMNEIEVRDALDSVSKDNFDGYESTEWSIVMNQSTKEMTYYHRENYEKGYTFLVN